MLIDWFTVGAQVLNFTILVWLLKRYLYKPILVAIDAREKRIAAQLADAARVREEANREREEFRLKSETFDRDRAALLGRATEEAKAERERLLDEARKAADELSARRQQRLRSDAENLAEAVGRHACQEVFAIARQALTDLAGTTLEARICEVFCRRLRAMDGDAKQRLDSALRTAAGPLRVRSACELTEQQRAEIRKAIDDTFPAAGTVRFEVSPALVSGIELSTDGQKIAWSIADYLASLETGIDRLLKDAKSG